MRILVLTSTFPRWQGDEIPTFILDLCTELSKHHEVTVLAPHYKYAKTKEAFKQVNVVRFRYAPESLEKIAYGGGINNNMKSNKLLYFLLPLFFISYSYHIYKLTKSHRIQAIHSHWIIPQGISFYLVYPFINKYNLFSICTVHGGDLYTANNFLFKLIKTKILKRFDKFCFVSNALLFDAKSILKFQTAKPCIAPMGVDLHKTFKPSQAIRKKPYQIAFAGRLVDKKGVDLALEAIHKIKQQYPDTTLIIAGEGPLAANLKKLVINLHLENNVIFTGYLTHKELAKLFQTSSIAIFPFRKSRDGDLDGLGLTPIEAMGCNCPVITSDISATNDYIIDGKTGLHFREGDSDDLAKKIDQLLSNSTLLKSISNNGRKYVISKYSWETTAQNYSDIFNTGLNERVK